MPCRYSIYFIFSLRKQVEKKTLQLRKATVVARQNEQKYRIIAENTSDVVWLSDFSFTLSYISPSVEKMLGEKASGYLKKNIEEKYPPKYIAQLNEILNEELENEKIDGYSKNRSRILELEHFHADGSTLWVEMNVSFVRDTAGRPTGLHGVMRDITEKVKARKYIQKRLAMEKLLSKISRKAIGDPNPEKILPKILKHAGSAMGISRAYVFRYNSQFNSVSNTFEWCATGIRPRGDKLQQQSCEFSWVCKELKQGRVVKFKNTEKIPDDATKKDLRLHNVISVLIVPLVLNDRFYGYIGFDECIKSKKWHSEDVKVLQSLAFIVTSLIVRHKTDRELTIKDRSIELSLVGKAIADLNGRITYANQTFLKYWRYNNVEEIVNKTVYSFWESSHESMKVIKAIREDGSWKGELKGIRADGTLFDALVQASLVTGNDGNPLCMQASFFDITDRKIWERELMEAKEKAEESNRLKSAFLANISHEIRTPMNGILGFLNLLKEVNFSVQEKEEFIEKMNESGKRLLNTLNDIMESATIEAGGTAVHADEVNFSELMQSSFDFFRPEAERKNITFRMVNNVQVNSVITDKYKLERILYNLVNNALKFTEQGTVEFGAELKGKFLKFYVKDTGTGIPEDQAGKIFGQFIQAEMGLERRFEGAGLGLSISKAYVEKLGGKIWYSSTKNEGSIFNFKVPYKPAYSVEVHPALHQKLAMDNLLKGHKILIAEDDQFSYLFLEISLKNLGAEIIHTETGEDTIRALLDNPDISLILMDIKMKGMNGIEATRRIRDLNVKVPIIAQTALAFADEQNKALEAGCNEHITKPIDKELLLKKIRKLLN